MENQEPRSEIVAPLNETCSRLRRELKGIEETLRALKGHQDIPVLDKFPNQTSEIRAQIMLAVRHVEDARMRIGKVMQYADDGVSILDK